MPVLRRPHDHHRALRTRLDPAPPPKPAPGGDQDRYLMSIFIRSLSLNPVRFRRCPSAEHVSSRLNSLLAIKLSPKPAASVAPKRSAQMRCRASCRAIFTSLTSLDHPRGTLVA